MSQTMPLAWCADIPCRCNLAVYNVVASRFT
jgi:hypothetical protein